MSDDAQRAFAHLPVRSSERGVVAFLLASSALALGIVAVAVTGAWRGRTASSPSPVPPVAAVASTPGHAGAPSGSAAPAIVAQRPASEQGADLTRFGQQAPTHVLARWEQGFYPLYELAQRTFGVNWLLLASIHKQETAFSTDATTYHGLNFAHCCGGPMQFNVTNKPVPTWRSVGGSYRYAHRPASYNHQTAVHPSIYDDFDAMMAAGRLLSVDGASLALDGSAWRAAYAYYGHDATGVTYADQVLARAVSWSQHGFCINCRLDPAMVAAVHAAYGAPVLAQLQAEQARRAKARHARHARPSTHQRRARPARPARPSRRPRSR